VTQIDCRGERDETQLNRRVDGVAALVLPRKEPAAAAETSTKIPSEEEIAAVRYVSGFKQADDELFRSLCVRLPAWCLKEQVEKYRSRQELLTQDPPNISQKRIKTRWYSISSLRSHVEAGLDFKKYLHDHGVAWDPSMRLPYGMFRKYLHSRPDLKRLAQSKEATHRLREFLKRGITNSEGGRILAERGGAKTLHAYHRDDGQRRFVRNSFRKKQLGAYGLHLKKACLVRQSLFHWFSVLRHSIDYKVMTRFPPKVVEVKAKQLVQDYVVACLENGTQPDPPVINSKWLSRWRMEYRLSFRRPNRKFKVPKKVLEERLLTFWLNCYRLRYLAFQILGYDLEFDNLDQSPFHMNEAGLAVFFSKALI
jgi:hypothetical protein